MINRVAAKNVADDFKDVFYELGLSLYRLIDWSGEIGRKDHSQINKSSESEVKQYKEILSTSCGALEGCVYGFLSIFTPLPPDPRLALLAIPVTALIRRAHTLYEYYKKYEINPSV